MEPPGLGGVVWEGQHIVRRPRAHQRGSGELPDTIGPLVASTPLHTACAAAYFSLISSTPLAHKGNFRAVPCAKVFLRLPGLPSSSPDIRPWCFGGLLQQETIESKNKKTHDYNCGVGIYPSPAQKKKNNAYGGKHEHTRLDFR